MYDVLLDDKQERNWEQVNLSQNIKIYSKIKYDAD